MSTAARTAFATEIAPAAGWTVLDDMFLQESPIRVEFDMYVGPEGNRVMIGWLDDRSAVYVATKRTGDERMTEIKGVMGLVEARAFMESLAVTTA
jgi:hypothetical protein